MQLGLRARKGRPEQVFLRPGDGEVILWNPETLVSVPLSVAREIVAWLARVVEGTHHDARKLPEPLDLSGLVLSLEGDRVRVERGPDVVLFDVGEAWALQTVLGHSWAWTPHRTASARYE